MNWKTIRAGLMAVLIVINIALFWMNRLETDPFISGFRRGSGSDS